MPRSLPSHNSQFHVQTKDHCILVKVLKVTLVEGPVRHTVIETYSRGFSNSINYIRESWKKRGSLELRSLKI